MLHVILPTLSPQYIHLDIFTNVIAWFFPSPLEKSTQTVSDLTDILITKMIIPIRCFTCGKVSMVGMVAPEYLQFINGWSWSPEYQPCIETKETQNAIKNGITTLNLHDYFRRD